MREPSPPSVTPETSHSKKDSRTAAGQADHDLIDAINQVFSLFSINYHNQYYSAFREQTLEIQAKRLWLESLQQFTPETVLRAARKVIEESEYLPTLHKMITLCQATSTLEGLPDVHSAYLEACRAPSPKAAFNWSHTAVYHAGRACDWYFLANNPERVTYPVFKEQYQRITSLLASGESLETPQYEALPDKREEPLSKEENSKRLDELRKSLEL